MKDCVGVFGRIFGHKFYARYSVIEREIKWGSDFDKSLALLSSGRDGMIRVEREYVGEVCTRCGTWLGVQDSVADEISR